MSDKKALLVIDLQNDYLWDKRKTMFSYDTETLVGNVNGLINHCVEKDYDIIYIKHILPNNPIMRKLVGFSIEGTEGTEIYEGVNIVSDLCFEKNLPNSYTSKDFSKHMKEQGYKRILICGLNECGCVGATAKAAIKTGAQVIMIGNCIGRRFADHKVRKMRKSLISMGVKYKNMKAED